MHGFLIDVEEAIRRIHESADDDVEGILLQAELLLRDVVRVEDLLPPEEGEIVVVVLLK